MHRVGGVADGAVQGEADAMARSVPDRLPLRDRWSRTGRTLPDGHSGSDDDGWRRWDDVRTPLGPPPWGMWQ